MMTNGEAARKLFDIKHDDHFSWTQESVDAFDLAISALFDLSVSSLEKNSKEPSETRKRPKWANSIRDALLFPCQSTLEMLPDIPATGAPEECEDAVSRKAVYEAMIEKGQRSRRYRLGETWELNGAEIRETLDTVPPVTPKRKTGKWIEHSFSEDGKTRLIECSECGAAYMVNCLCDYSIFVEERRYCNKCGAKMDGFRLTFVEEQNCEGHVACSVVYSDVMEGALLELPSAQPESCEDAVSRRAATAECFQSMVVLSSEFGNELPDGDKRFNDGLRKAIEKIRELPSVTPKPKVHCKECKHYEPSTWKEDSGWCNVENDYETGIEMTPDDYCSRGERR